MSVKKLDAEELFEYECKKVRHYFWEFYALNHLWFKLGGGMEACGYKPTTFVSSRLYDKINYKMEEITDKFFLLTYRALEESIRSEMKYVFRPGSRFGDAFELSKFCKKNNWTDTDSVIEKRAIQSLNGYLKIYDSRIRRAISSKNAPIEWAQVAFLWDGWSSSYCGKNWADACSIFLEAKNLRHIKDKVYWIDRCLDLYHNNGPLLDKTAYTVLHDVGDLNERAKLRSWPMAVKYNTPIEEFIEGKSEHDPMECTIVQDMFPLSSFTKGVIIANSAKI